MTSSVRADAERCEGHANCLAAAPDVFGLDDDGVVRVLRVNVLDDQRVYVAEAVASCPVAALWLDEA
ncbi:phthalate 3,4-dioxygenase ferredoxin subunit (plasmid) [Pseudonocardia dioxanivorans CB1190]|uniref:Phthalate 3,4-dioxygenase ferredoxin subunit n=1 Tax=Pseudonocardia dioxanivorans (strain ATCC 55486 / DSM 44775 / JCM 13855 / CB1190) TaxID=675635 RepID=F2L729_PSEUX|nr:ferredoxin [Pseudonocardia dioxanivorans]AEA29002.1 phthalate 3,4-dioxygenase ferredoxin subunit [Pseudonocardia dioxanivorans CB1190]